ncbi:MAG: flippase-like domain-containing protein [Gammaproteobacteria bacterium]|nr:flippase-like domain-containing protein [Gammaproteobacteria bacterium]
MQTKSKQALLVTFKLAITIGLLYYLLSGVGLKRLHEILITVPPATILAAIALHIISYGIGGFRWWLLANNAGLALSFKTVLPSYYLGIFFNNFLPTGIGGDVVRILHLRRSQVSTPSLIASTVSDRLIGLSVMFATGLSAFAALKPIFFDNGTRVILFLLALAAVVSIWVFASDWFGALIARLTYRYRHTRVRKSILEIVAVLHDLRNRKWLLMKAVVLSLLIQSLIILCYYVLALGIGIDKSLMLFFAIIPVVIIATTLPISIGGLGVREGALVSLLLLSGVPRDAAVGLSLVYLIVFWCASLPGLAVMVLSSARGQRIDTST